MRPKSSFQASKFEKVLQAFDLGDLPYADVQFHLQRLLAAGAPPEELLEVLRRCELSEPLPEYAHAEVLALINEAITQASARNTESPPAADESGYVDSALNSLPSPPQPRAAMAITGALPPDSVSGDPLKRSPVQMHSFARDTEATARLTERVRSLEEQVAAQNADYKALTRSYERARDAGSAATARIIALAADLAAARTALESEQSKTRDINKALVDRTAAEDAARSRGEEERREAARYQAELRALRDSLAARDAAIVQARVSLGERDAQLAALQGEHAKIVAAIESRASIATKLEAELLSARTGAAALAADLAAARTALASEQLKAQELDQALAARLAAEEAAQSRGKEALLRSERYQTDLRNVRDSLAARDRAIAQVQQALSERDAQLAAAQDDLARIVAEFEARAKTMAAELQAAQGRVDAVTRELKTSQDAAAMLTAQREQGESRLTAARTEFDALQTQSESYLEILKTREWRSGFDQNRFRESDAADELPVAAAAVAESPAAPTPIEFELHAEIAELDAEVTAPKAAVQARTAAQSEPEPSARIPEYATSEPGRNRKSGAIALAIGITAVVLALAAAAWFIVQRATAPPAVPAALPSGPRPGTVIHDCPTCPAVTVVPAGRFQQGSAGAENGAAAFEAPAHWVAIGYPFAITTNAVTLDEFRAFITATGRNMQGCETYDGEWKLRAENSWENPGFVQSGSHPVTCTSWNDAKAYAGWLSTQTGHRYRLPSASEWEYAARAGNEAVQPWNPDGSGACASANVADASAARKYPGWTVFPCDDGYIYTAPVGSFKASALGLNDMLGNVFQWTEDCWHADYTGAPVNGSARTDGDCSEHELRGGSWFSTPAFVRANYRNHFDANYRTSSVGMRLVRDIAP
jgi:formylglycine-generating enzyme required for sulfatase activity